MKFKFPLYRQLKTKDRKHAIVLSVTCLGVSSIVTQIICIREFLNVFSGNELVLGLILGNWLMLTGLGSFLGRYADKIKHPIRWLVFFQIAIALLPPIQIVAVRLIKQLVLPGLMLGIGNAFLASLLLLLPYCLASGFLLTLFACVISDRRDAQQIGDIYILDTIGDIVGGIIFSFVLVYFFTPFQTVAFLLILNLLAATILSFTIRRKQLALITLGVLGSAVVVFWSSDPDWSTGQALFPGQELVQQQSTPYGNLVVTRQESQITVYENGIPLGSSEDPIAAEEIVHYALSQHLNPRHVLLLSGGITGAHLEIEKYRVERIDYVELDPAVLELVRKIRPLAKDTRVKMIAEDARRFVKSVKNGYDAILVDLPDPATAQLNRFYTVEFFSEVSQALRPDGVFSFNLSGAENYANPQIRLLTSAVYRSLSTVFSEVLIIPGSQQFFIAAHQPLDYDIAERLQQRGIETKYVNADYLTAKLTEDRIATAQAMVAVPAALNRDFFPGTYFAHLQYWLSQFGSSLLLPSLFVVGIIILLGVLLSGSRQRIVPAALAASGFAGMGLEVILLIAFQVCYGYVYKQIGLIITAFMIGSAIGARWAGKHKDDQRSLMFKLDSLLSGVAFFLAPILLSIRGAESPLMQSLSSLLVFPLLTAIIGFLTGAQFPLTAKLTFQGVAKTTGNLYAIDLLGACLGALVVSAFCIPLLGITATCYLIGGIKLVTAVMLGIHREVPIEVPHRPQPKMGKLFAFGLVLLVFIVIGGLIMAEDTHPGIYSFSLIPVYHWLILALMGFGILMAMEIGIVRKNEMHIVPAIRRFAGKISQQTKVKPQRWIYYFAFALVTFYPVFRCYFKVPYLFCHVCPRLCIFGYLRPYLIPAALIMNLEKRHWCFQACPIGTLYHCQAHSGGKPIRRFRFLYYIALGVTAFTAIAYFKLKWDLENQPIVTNDWYTFFFKNEFTVSGIVIIIAVLLLVFGYRLRRAFCETLCPVGNFSELVSKLEKFLNKKGIFGGARTIPKSLLTQGDNGSK